MLLHNRKRRHWDPSLQLAVQARLAAKAQRLALNEERIQRRLYPVEGDVERQQQEIQQYQDALLQRKLKHAQDQSDSSLGGQAMEHPWAMPADDATRSAQVHILHAVTVMQTRSAVHAMTLPDGAFCCNLVPRHRDPTHGRRLSLQRK